jgi:hypothetical protein
LPAEFRSSCSAWITARRSLAKMAPVSAYGVVRSTTRSVSSHLASGYTYSETTGPNTSSHMSWYAESCACTSVGSMK